MSRDDYTEKRKKEAKEKRRQQYQLAKQRKKEYDAEIKRKILEGEMEKPAAWIERERREAERKAEAKRQRQESYQAAKKKQLSKKEAERTDSRTPKEELWGKIMHANEIERLKELAKNKQHLRLIKPEQSDS